jgi:Rieske Fe-S protein
MGSRRVRWVFWVVFGAGAITGVVVVVVALWPSDGGSSLRTFTVEAEQVPAAGADPVLVGEGRFWLVHLLPGEGVHAGRGVSGPGGLVALSAIDPHNGDEVFNFVAGTCDVPWRAEFEFEGEVGWFRNGCGSATYTVAGVWVFGPSPRGLDTLDVRVQRDGSVRVNTSVVTPGADDNALRAVAYGE